MEKNGALKALVLNKTILLKIYYDSIAKNCKYIIALKLCFIFSSKLQIVSKICKRIFRFIFSFTC